MLTKLIDLIQTILNLIVRAIDKKQEDKKLKQEKLDRLNNIANNGTLKDLLKEKQIKQIR